MKYLDFINSGCLLKSRLPIKILLKGLSPLILMLSFIALVPVLTSISSNSQSEKGILTAKPFQDYTLTILATGNWSGRFNVDNEGRGSLAALHSYTQRKRNQMRLIKGSLIFVYTGNFTGATNSQKFLKKIFLSKINLSNYLKFDIFALSRNENSYLMSSRKNHVIKAMPLVDFNESIGKNTISKASLIPPFRIITKDKYTIFTTSFSKKLNLLHDPRPLEKLQNEILKNINTDFMLLLFNRNSGIKANQAEVSRMKNNLNQLVKTGNISPMLNPFSKFRKSNALSNRVFAIFAGTQKNRFYRLINGYHVCAMKDMNLCEIEIRLRGKEIVSLTQRFINLNGKDYPGAWIRPDPFLMRNLQN